ncbi:DUF6479 family protein [Streptomyces varsoviensis]|uniref:DUF6479 family protein n=1 Tax=Streptomyces varsoviensis TaxID=67373 RepID=UPI0004C48607|nr:DUF6479 family protein [Streptomyces varsoviensis]
MHSEIFYLAADNGLRGGIAPLAVGIVVVALLIGAVAYGRRRREREPAPPQEPQERAGSWQTPEEQSGPVPSDHGPGHDGERDALGYVKEGRASDELAPDGHRYLPHELTDPDSHSDPEQKPRKWNEGGSGGFGSGGGGHT